MYRKQFAALILSTAMIMCQTIPPVYASETIEVGTEIETKDSKKAKPQKEKSAEETHPQTEKSAEETHPQTEKPAEETRPQTEKPAEETRPQTEKPAEETHPQTEKPAEEIQPQTSKPTEDQKEASSKTETEIITVPETEQKETAKKKETEKNFREDSKKQSKQTFSEEEHLKESAKVDASTTLPDGAYQADSFTFSGGTGKLVIGCKQIVVRNHTAYAILTFSSNSVHEVQWAGGSKESTEAIKEIEVPVALNQDNPIVLMTNAMSEAHYIQYTIRPELKEPESEITTEPTTESETEPATEPATEPTTESETESETEPITESETEPATEPKTEPTTESETESETEPITESETEPITETEPAKKNKYFDKNGKLKDGEYSVHNVELAPGYQMFNVISCELTCIKGKITAVITLNGTGYDYLYLGTKEEAVKAKKSQWIPAVPDKTGHFTYALPIAEFDKVIVIAARSKRYAQEGAAQPWYDKGLIFHSDSLQKTGDPYVPPETEKQTEKQTEKPTDPYPQNTGGTTGAVDNATKLADGTYKPDSFGYSGGTGRLSISCTGITVSGGKAYATLVFSSGKIIYVKANGSKYSPTSQTGSSTTFSIPVQLNGNTRIIACTTAMSKPHEVDYNISIGLKAALSVDKTEKETEPLKDSAEEAGLSEDVFTRVNDAPEIIGLTYTGSYKAEKEEYFRLHYYKDGFKVLEISLEDSEHPTFETEAPSPAQEPAETVEASDDEEAQETETPEISLYNQDVIRYLLVPEDGELPAGIEKEMCLIPIPVDSIYTPVESAEKLIKDLDKNITLFSEEDCGDYDSDDLFLELLLNEVKLAIVPETILTEEGKVSKVGEDLKLLSIPMIVDRSADEKTPEAKQEWRFVYASLLGKETET